MMMLFVECVSLEMVELQTIYIPMHHISAT